MIKNVLIAALFIGSMSASGVEQSIDPRLLEEPATTINFSINNDDDYTSDEEAEALAQAATNCAEKSGKPKLRCFQSIADFMKLAGFSPEQIQELRETCYNHMLSSGMKADISKVCYTFKISQPK